MKIECMALGMVQTNTYFIIDEATNKTILVDPAGEANRILKHIEESGLQVEKICLTHGHFDHIGAVEAVRRATGAEVIIHKEGERYLSDDQYNLAAVFTGQSLSMKADDYVEDGEVITLEDTDIALQVIHVPGHTLDGVAYYSETYAVAFVGDILFRGSIGRTDFPGGDTAMLLKGIKEKLFTLPEDVTIYSGHGEPTSIGHEKRSNPNF